MSRPLNDYAAVHKAADYYEPLMRSKFVKAIKALRKRVTLQQIVMAMQTKTPIIPRSQLEEALKPAAKVIHDAVMYGGKLGAVKVNEVIK